MKKHEAILGEFENELYAKIARRDLETAGISATIIEDNKRIFILFSGQNNVVQREVTDTQIEKAKKILAKRFYYLSGVNDAV